MFVSIMDWWHQIKSISDGGETWITASDEFKFEEEEEIVFNFLLEFLSESSLSCLSSNCLTSCHPQSSSSFDTLVAMSLKAKGAPHRRLNLTPLLWPSPLGSWQTSASNATRAPATPWVQDKRKGPARWTWQPQPWAASRSASTTSAGSRGLRTLTSQPHRGVRGSDAFWCPDRWRLKREAWFKQKMLVKIECGILKRFVFFFLKEQQGDNKHRI